jgi:hypothetical protein
MIVVRGHRGLAEAYACHVLDVYDHYAWRWWLAKDPEKFGKPLAETNAWQNQYKKSGKIVSSELNFWLGARSSVMRARRRRLGQSLRRNHGASAALSGRGVRARLSRQLNQYFRPFAVVQSERIHPSPAADMGHS